MKNFIIIICMIFLINFNSQNSSLIENSWFLQSLNSNTIKYIPPQNELGSSVEAIFNESFSTIETEYCIFISRDLIYDETNCSFHVLNEVQYLVGLVFFESITFYNQYVIYFREGSVFKNPFVYEITDDNGIRYLEITISNGDTALYANQVLSTNNVGFSDIKVFPNHLSDVLNMYATNNSS